MLFKGTGLDGITWNVSIKREKSLRTELQGTLTLAVWREDTAKEIEVGYHKSQCWRVKGEKNLKDRVVDYVRSFYGVK